MTSTSERPPALRTRIQQQEVVARLGQSALETDDPDQLIDEVSLALADTLDTEYVSVLERRPDDALVLRHAIGWPEERIGTAMDSATGDSPAERTLESAEPIVVGDLRADDRFSSGDRLAGHDLVSSMSAIIGPVDDPWGVLQTHTAEKRAFTEHDANFLRSIANLLAGAIDRTETERRLRERETQLDVASKAGSIGLWTWDIRNDVVTADESLAEAYDMPPEAVKAGAPMAEFYEPIHDDDTERTWERLDRAVSETGELDVEYRVDDGSGDVQWVVARGEVVYDDDGEPVRMTGAVADITERKERERELAERTEFLSALVETTPECIKTVAADGTLLQMNPAGLEMIEADSGVLGGCVYDLIAPEHREEFRAFNERICAGERGTLEFDIIGLEGTHRHMETHAAPLHHPDESTSQVALTRDVTGQVERERELERTLDLLEKTQRIADVGGWEIDAETEDVFWTDHVFDLLEVSADEEPPLDEALDMYHDADRPVVEEAIGDALDAGDSFDREVRIRTAGDDERWLRLQGVPETVDGEVVSVRGAAQDVTERKLLEGRAGEILSRVTDAFYALDTDFRFTHVNERAAELLQHSEAELLGECLWDVFPSAAEIDEVWDAFHTARDDQESTSYELYYDRLDFRVEANLYPSETGISVYFRDITERVEREQALAESEQRYRALAENFPNGIVTLFDTELRYTLAAGKAFDVLPVSANEIEGRPVRDVWDGEVGETLDAAYRHVLDDEKRSIEIAYEDREWLVHAVPITDETGDVFAGLTIAQDVTERVEREKALETSNERLEQFAYAASHDLQEPLRMVSSYLQLIERRYADVLDEDGEEFLEFAVDGADRMREMINSLLEYSRIESRGKPLEPVSLDAVVADVCDDLQVRIEEHDAEITGEDLPRVNGDVGQLRQLVQNLLTNAIEYCGDEPPRVHLSAERSGPMWEVAVTDEGIGIDADQTERIFKVFERLHTREEHPGTGIGLSLCRRIVERHGGEIRVESEPGEGSTFTVTLPAVETTAQ